MSKKYITNMIVISTKIANDLGLNESVIFSLIKDQVYNRSGSIENFGSDGRVSAYIYPSEIKYIPHKEIRKALDRLVYNGLIEYSLNIFESGRVSYQCRLPGKTSKEHLPNTNHKNHPPRPPRVGYVYFARDTSLQRFIKIGFSKKPLYREKTLQAEKPTIVFISTHFLDSSYEDSLHEYFKSKRIRGEWFEVSYDQCLEALNKFSHGKI